MLKTVKFVDEGQDFLEWDIEYPDNNHDIVGTVVACRPFQEEVWKGTEVYSKEIRPGDLLPVVSTISYRPMTLIHPVESVVEREFVPMHKIKRERKP